MKTFKPDYKNFYVDFSVTLNLGAVVKARSPQEVENYLSLPGDNINEYVTNVLINCGYDKLEIKSCASTDVYTDDEIDFDVREP